MPKIVPDSFDLPGRLDVATGEIVEAKDWQGFIEAGNHLFARSGIRIGGQCFDPEWETTSGTYTAATSGDGFDLDQIHATGRLLRLLLGAQFKLTLRGFMADCELRLEVVRHDDTGITSLGTTVATQGTASTAWAESTLVLAQDETLVDGVSGSDPQALGFLLRARTPGATARLYQYDIIAKIADPKELPDGS